MKDKLRILKIGEFSHSRNYLVPNFFPTFFDSPNTNFMDSLCNSPNAFYFFPTQDLSEISNQIRDSISHEVLDSKTIQDILDPIYGQMVPETSLSSKIKIEDYNFVYFAPLGELSLS